MRRKEKERIEWKKSNMKRRVEKKEKGAGEDTTWKGEMRREE